MIRPFTFLTLAAACGSGMYLYSEKHHAEMLDRQIARVIHQTEATRQTTSLLQAEWQVLNNPDRLRPLAQKYLNLVPVQPTQWVQLADLGTRLPQPAPPGTNFNSAPAPDAADLAAADSPAAPDAPLAAAPANPGIDEGGPPPPAEKSAGKPVPPPQQAARLVAHAAPRKHSPVVVADKDPPLHARPLAHSTPLALATPQPSHPRILSALARPFHAAQPAVATALPSSLGVRTAVPAPVPLGDE